MQRNNNISVIMSCHNADRWLSEAIESVLAQTHVNFEFIIVDDGSTDGTSCIIRKYMTMDDRIIPIFKEHSSLAESLNKGIACARGKWIARMDADDICEPTRLEQQFDFVRKYPDIVLLGSAFTVIDEHGRPIKKKYCPRGHNKLVRHLERSMRFFPHSSAFYRADVAKAIKGYNIRFLRSQDWRLWLEMSSMGKIDSISQPLLRIRKHGSQVSNDYGGGSQSLYGLIASVCYFLKKAGLDDPSSELNEQKWLIFRDWVASRIDQSGIIEQRKSWMHARAAYFSTEHKLVGLCRAGIRLVRSGYIAPILWKKYFGSTLAQRLASEWIAFNGNVFSAGKV